MSKIMVWFSSFNLNFCSSWHYGSRPRFSAFSPLERSRCCFAVCGSSALFASSPFSAHPSRISIYSQSAHPLILLFLPLGRPPCVPRVVTDQCPWTSWSLCLECWPHLTHSPFLHLPKSHSCSRDWRKGKATYSSWGHGLWSQMAWVLHWRTVWPWPKLLNLSVLNFLHYTMKIRIVSASKDCY